MSSGYLDSRPAPPPNLKLSVLLPRGKPPDGVSLNDMFFSKPHSVIDIWGTVIDRKNIKIKKQTFFIVIAPEYVDPY